MEGAGGEEKKVVEEEREKTARAFRASLRWGVYGRVTIGLAVVVKIGREGDGREIGGNKTCSFPYLNGRVLIARVKSIQINELIHAPWGMPTAAWAWLLPQARALPDVGRHGVFSRESRGKPDVPIQSAPKRLQPRFTTTHDRRGDHVVPDLFSIDEQPIS